MKKITYPKWAYPFTIWHMEVLGNARIFGLDSDLAEYWWHADDLCDTDNSLTASVVNLEPGE